MEINSKNSMMDFITRIDEYLFDTYQELDDIEEVILND